MGETNKVFEEAIQGGKLIKTMFLPQYLKWIEGTAGGLSAVREFYNKQMRGTADLHFIQTCIEIEESHKDVKILRSLYEKLIADHGENSSHVWLAYISFESTMAQDFDRVGKIYLKAKKTLKGKLNA